MSQDTKTNEAPKRAVVAAVQLPYVSDAELESSLQELRQLAKTLGFEVVGTFTQKRARFDPAAYFGLGKRQEIRAYALGEPLGDSNGEGAPEEEHADAQAEEDDAQLAAADDHDDDDEAVIDPARVRAEVILVDHEISPSQARILEKDTALEVMDRTMVIL